MLTELEIQAIVKQQDRQSMFNSKLSTKTILHAMFPQCEAAKVKEVDDAKLAFELLNIEEKMIETKYKFGVLLLRESQGSDDDAIFSNNDSDAGPLYQEFLRCIGQRILLKGFTGFRGGLDVKEDTTGTESVVANYKDFSIMFHVSTMLPFSSTNKQQIARKAHIGNDLGIIVFNEGTQPFDTACLVSQFPHVYLVVQPLR